MTTLLNISLLFHLCNRILSETGFVALKSVNIEMNGYLHLRFVDLRDILCQNSEIPISITGNC